MKTIQATYQDGVFKPSEPVPLPAGTNVRVLLPESREEKLARLREMYPNSFGVMNQEDADAMEQAIEKQRHISTTFKPLPESWK